MPNLQPVTCGPLQGGEQDLPIADAMQGSWAVSFGMPSREPDVWRRDIEWTRRRLDPEKLLVVSVVGTVEPGSTIDELAQDYARCASWAHDSGADAVEANLSCPNVSTCDGQLYQNPADARRVASCIRDAIGERPLVLKVGHLMDPTAIESLVAAVHGLADALSMTNSIAATVVDASGTAMFDGQRRGICGAAIRQSSLRQVGLFCAAIRRRRRSSEGCDLGVIGVGGICDGDQVRSFLDAGAEGVQLATAVMHCPTIGLEVRRQLNAVLLKA
jgi:dihydroorotate dehydrogenase